MTRAVVVLALLSLAGCGKPAKRHSTTTLVVHVTADGKPVAARVLLIDASNQPVHVGGIDLYGKRQGGAACAIAPNVIGSWDGRTGTRHNCAKPTHG